MRLWARAVDRVLGPPVPHDELPCAVPDGVTVRRGSLVPRVGGWFMGGTRGPAGAVTFGRTILANPDTPLTDDLIVHELVHVEQWKDPLFALKYCAQWMRHGYRQNPYEVEAYERQARFAARRGPLPPRTP